MLCMKGMRLMNDMNGWFRLSLDITDVIVTMSMLGLPSRMSKHAPGPFGGYVTSPSHSITDDL